MKALNSDSKIAVKSLRSELEEDLDGALSRLRTAENAITETRDHVLSKQDKAFAHIKHVVCFPNSESSPLNKYKLIIFFCTL